MWIRRDSNTLRPYQESFNIFNSLIALNVEIVYLFGNHDCIMWEYKGKHSLPGGAFFTVYVLAIQTRRAQTADGKEKKSESARTSFSTAINSTSSLDMKACFDSEILWDSAQQLLAVSRGLGCLVRSSFFTVGVVFSPLFINWLPSLLNSITPLEQSLMIAVLTLFSGWLVGAIAFLGVLWLFTL